MFKFLDLLIKEIKEDKMTLVANDLSYHLILAVFPFIIFLMSLFSILKLDVDIIRSSFGSGMPEIIYSFMNEVGSVKSAGVLSLGLLLSLNSSATGLRSAIKGINGFYRQSEQRGFIKLSFISFALVIVFSFAVILTGLIPVLGNILKTLLLGYGINSGFLEVIFGIGGYIVSAVVIAAMIMLFYWLGIIGKKSISSLLPGTAVTLVLWLAASKLFSLYIKIFGDFSRLYGSIGGVIGLLYWLNILSFSILLGAEINAVLELMPGKDNSRQ